MKKSFYYGIVMLALIATSINIAYSQPPWDPGNTLATQKQYVGWNQVERIALENYYAVVPFEDIIEPPVYVDDCYNRPDTDCDVWSAWTINCKAVVKHPILYPNCPLEATFSYRYCIANPALVQIRIVKWAYRVTTWPELFDCIGRYDYMSSGTLEEQGRKANQLDCDLYGLLSKYIFEMINQAYIDVTGGPILCNTPNEQVKVSYTKGSCSGFCISIVYNNGVPKKVITPNSCTVAFCCKFVNIFCIEESSGNLRHITEKTNDLKVPCTGLSPLSNCPGGVATVSTPCINSCDVEFLNLSN